MKIKMNKKWLLVLLIVIFTLISMYFLYRLPFINNKENEEKYKNLYEYCIEDNENNEDIKVCRVFLQDFFINDSDQACFDILLPTTNIEERYIEICEDRDIVNWENPYANYSLSIPVYLNIYQKKQFLLGNVIEKIEFNLMEDSEAYSLLDQINKETTQVIQFRSASYTQDLEERGYFLGKSSCEAYDSGCPSITIYSVEIISYYEEGDELFFNLKMFISGQYIEKQISTTEFQFQELSNEGEIVSFEDINVKENNIWILEDGNVYQMVFLITGIQEIPDSLIENYVKGDTDLDLDLRYIFNTVNVE